MDGGEEYGACPPDVVQGTQPLCVSHPSPAQVLSPFPAMQPAPLGECFAVDRAVAAVVEGIGG